MPDRPVKVATLGINYAPEPTGITPHSTGIAVAFAARGNRVTTLNDRRRYRPYWRRNSHATAFRSDEVIGGVRVRRFKHPVPSRASWSARAARAARAAREIAFGLRLVTTGWDRPDVVIFVTPPLLAAAIATIREQLTCPGPAIGIVIQDMSSRGITDTGANRDSFRLKIVLLSDGNQRAALQNLADSLPTIEFLPPVTEADFPAALGAADVLLVNERPGIAHPSVPSKLTSYFNSGKPVLAAADPAGLTASEPRASGAGISFPADRPDLLVKETMRLGADPEMASQLGDAGKPYWDVLLYEDTALDCYEQWIVDLATTRRRRKCRPAEVDTLVGDAPLAESKLGCQPKVLLTAFVKITVHAAPSGLQAVHERDVDSADMPSWREYKGTGDEA